MFKAASREYNLILFAITSYSNPHVLHMPKNKCIICSELFELLSKFNTYLKPDVDLNFGHCDFGKFLKHVRTQEGEQKLSYHG